MLLTWVFDTDITWIAQSPRIRITASPWLKSTALTLTLAANGLAFETTYQAISN